MVIGPSSQLLYLGIVLHGIRSLREEWTEEATEEARRAAAAGLQPVAVRTAVHEKLETSLGTFGVPVGWDSLEPSSLQMWRDKSGTAVVGGIVRTDPRPTSIIDVTALAGWLEEDPRDFLRLATDFRQPMMQAYAAEGLPIQEGPGTLMVDGYPAIWFYHAGMSDSTPLANAHVHVLFGNQIVGIQLMAAAGNFGRLVDGFWTVIATAKWK